MNKDQVKGVAKETMGKAQNKAGELTGSAEQRIKGLSKEAEGKVQKKVGDAKEMLKDANHKHP
ncbi:MAG: CsbD family protein [Polaromonas sp.]|uniref:CsbD family protein n=1 Tax=Polaromonas sp. TaxID=1869339 RepID=UPI0018167459|nr:CsbD family protein [Polaromonas sp.]NMM09603.1 CsbD family protein [Polaromonas sp.]